MRVYGRVLVKSKAFGYWPAVVAFLAAIIAVLPVLLHWKPAPPKHLSLHIALYLAYGVAAFLCYVFYRKEVKQLGRSRAIALVFLVLLLTCVTNEIHDFTVDISSSYIPTRTNEFLQESLQDSVIRLSPTSVPHAYRFLPNSIVLWMQVGGVPYSTGRNIYRLLCGLLIYYAIFRYARLYCDFSGGILAMLLTTAVYPISFERYIGQLTDPLSHLSFLLAFIFLETENFALLLVTLVIGSLAKETVLAMSGYYVLFCRKQNRYVAKAITLCLASLVIYFGVRLYVLHGTMQYQQISGVTMSHMAENWSDTHKRPILFVLTAGAYLPFLFLGWKDTPAALKHTVLYLLPVLFLSSLAFSWLLETRNYMPLVFVLAVVAARYLSAQFSKDLPAPEPVL